MTVALNPLTGTLNSEGSALTYAVEGSGIPVFVIGSSVYYPRTFSSKFRASCRVAYTDLRHFSPSDESFDSNSISIETYINDIECVREAIEFDRFVLIGHSHHGNVALEYAKKHPERVSHLVLIGSPPCNVRQTIESGNHYWNQHASEPRKAILEKNRASIGGKNDAKPHPEELFVAQYVADGPKYWYDATFDASALWKAVPVNIEALGAFKNFFVEYEFSWDPAHLNAPVLVVMGRHDYAVPHILWDEALPALRNVTYRLLEESGHTPQLEESPAFDQLFFEWLEQESVASRSLKDSQ
ncbi:MAG: alpha/beta hydrolase [Ectothiorhodospiraceae bacterium]|nr:alpha/beta hydrolase [Ectothiorhodospiraceae bacterium]